MEVTRAEPGTEGEEQMRITTHELGTLEVPEDSRVYLPEGLLGFGDLHDFALIDREEFRPFAWLVSSDNPDVSFAVTDPDRFRTGSHEISLSRIDEAALDLEAGDPIVIFVLVTISDGGRRITGNLRAPIAMNPRNRLARQIIVYGAGLSVRQQILSRRVVPLHSAIGNVPTRG
jgi:flagellar assembly factor FliW